ncbi:MAG: hypothetical protein ACAI34_19545 [Verrucomicrobium sp.]|nr:hypothetical protein [Verrucomicrobium sp.]
MRVFVSSQAVDRLPAALLIQCLREHGIEVEHSPSNPAHNHDPRWRNWYGVGLSEAISRCDLVVVVVDFGWSSSTWMAIEADAALFGTDIAPPSPMVYWDPDGIKVDSIGMICYLRSEIPRDLAAAVDAIKKLSGILS